MIDTILDFSIDHALIFVILLVLTVVAASCGAIWGYGRYHERQMRRRGGDIARPVGLRT